jgi:hypothetical protein
MRFGHPSMPPLSANHMSSPIWPDLQPQPPPLDAFPASGNAPKRPETITYGNPSSPQPSDKGGYQLSLLRQRSSLVTVRDKACQSTICWAGCPSTPTCPPTCRPHGGIAFILLGSQGQAHAIRSARETVLFTLSAWGNQPSLHAWRSALATSSANSHM